MTTDMLLERLDLALADDPSADAEMLTLVADVRAETPQMTTEFAAALDERVRTGFAAEPRAARGAFGWHRFRRPNLFVMGPLAAGVAAVLVVVAVGGGSGGSSSPTTHQGGEAIALHRTPAPAPEDTASKSAGSTSADAGGISATAAPSVSAATPAAPSASFVTPTAAPGRKVERIVQLALLTTTDNVQAVAAGVVRTTQGANGFVASSQVQIDGTQGTATFTLRIPSARLEPTLTALSRLAKVTSMNQTTQDITGEFASTNTRLARLQTQLLTLQRRKQTPVTIVKERAVRRAIAGERAAQSQLRHRADYVTVNLTVTGKGHRHHVAPHHNGGGGFSPGDALRTAEHILRVGAGVLIIAATILIPLALLLGAFALAGRSVRRRHREAALKTS